MADRKPLVRVGGKSKQLPAGDILPFTALPVGYNENTVAAGDDPRIVYANTPNWQGVGANVNHLENGLFTVSDPLNGPTVDYAGDTEKIWFVRDTYEVARVQTAHWASAPAGVAAESKIYVRTKPHWSVAWTPWVKLLLDAPTDNKTYGRKDGKWAEVAVGGGAVTPGLFCKSDPSAVAFTKTGAGTAQIKAGIKIDVAGTLVEYTSATSISMPSLTAGTDYVIWVKGDATIQATAKFVSAPGAGNWRKVGGFHYAPGGNATARAGGDATPAINEYSFWDLKFRPACPDPRGMALISGGFWSDIYLMGVDHIVNGTSKYNVTIADGSAPPKIPLQFGGNGSTAYSTLNWWEAAEVMRAHGKRMPTYSEFAALAFGTTEAASSGTDPVSTILRQAYTSKWGVMLATGNMWVWSDEFGGRAAGAAWVANTGGRGSTFLMENAVSVGGAWGSAGNSGSRASDWSNSPTASNSSVGARGVANHLILD